MPPRPNVASINGTRQLGQVRLSARGEAIKLPPVDLIPTRSFEGTFVRGHQFGKPPVVSVGTQVNEHNLVFRTPDPTYIREESDNAIPESTASVLGQLRRPMERIEEVSVSQSNVEAGESNSTEVLRLKLQVEELADELHDVKEREKTQREKSKRLGQLLSDANDENKNQANLIASLQAQLQQERINNQQDQEKAANAQLLQDEIDHLQSLNEQMLEDQERVKCTLDSLQADREKLLEEMKQQHVKEMAALRNEMEKAVFLRDEKVERMKKNMEALMGDKSNERQKQIDDMSKDLAKVQDECELLRSKMRNYQTKQKASCDNCGRLSYKLEEKLAVLQQKDKQIQQYIADNNILRGQLISQDDNIDEIAQKRASKTITVYK